jgi:Icc-related predicted phosphoesterase
MTIENIFAFSDTHGMHHKTIVPAQVDMLVFAGDACEFGDARELWAFLKWFSQQPAKHKLFVPGNHDLLFDTHSDIVDALIPQGVTYIEKGEITLDGVRFYVLPARPYLHVPAVLPAGIDILVTHGAPAGILDDGYGCALLRDTVEQHPPKRHVFGHNHANGGQSVSRDKTTFYNVSVFNNYF